MFLTLSQNVEWASKISTIIRLDKISNIEVSYIEDINPIDMLSEGRSGIHKFVHKIVVELDNGSAHRIETPHCIKLFMEAMRINYNVDFCFKVNEQ